MRKAIYTIAALIICFLLSISFFSTLINVFESSIALGLGIISFLTAIFLYLLTDPDLVREIEE